MSRIGVERFRCCVSNYYLSPRSPTGVDYYHVTSFSAQPDPKVRQLIGWADAKVRQGLRRLVPAGLGRKDLYEEKHQ
jgi:hypothetical protein